MAIQNKERRSKLIQLRSQANPATVVSGERLRRYVEHKLRTELPEEYKERLQAVYFVHPGIRSRLLFATLGRLLLSGGESSNPFVEQAIQYAVAACNVIFAEKEKKDALHKLLLQDMFGLDITVLGCNDFYSYRNQVNESSPIPIALSWKASSQEAQNGATDNQQFSVVFPKGNPIPSIKALTFYRSSTFSIDAIYTDTSDMQALPKISTYTIGPFQSTKGERAKLKVKVRLNIHEIISVESATMLEDEEVEIPVSAVKEPATKMDTDAGNDSASPGDVDMHDGSNTGVENGESQSDDKAERMETDAKIEAPKKKVKKTNVPVIEYVYGAMPSADLQKSVEKEFEMALQDRVMEETKDKKNAVEEGILDNEDAQKRHS